MTYFEKEQMSYLSRLPNEDWIACYRRRIKMMRGTVIEPSVEVNARHEKWAARWFNKVALHYMRKYPLATSAEIRLMAEDRMIAKTRIPPGWTGVAHCASCGYVRLPKAQHGERLQACRWCHTKAGDNWKHDKEAA